MYHVGRFSPVPSTDGLVRILGALCSPHSTCILGAGAEMPTVPGPGSMNRRVLTRIIKMTDLVSPGKFGSPSDRNWIKPVGYESSTFVSAAIRQLTPEVLRLLEHGETQPPSLSSAPVQYAAFRVFSPDLAIINLNTSRMAERFCPQSIVWNPHGGFNPGFPHGWDEKLLFDIASSGHEVAPGSQHNFEREAPGFYGPMEELWISYLLAGRADITLIGYSFAKWGDRLNDSELYRLFIANLYKTPVRITIIDPYGQELAARLAEDLGSRDVVCVPAYWNYLARAILDTLQGSPVHSSGIDDVARNILNRYFRLVYDGRAHIWRHIEQLVEQCDRRKISNAEMEAKRNVLLAEL
jgi:hypothetical protein